MTPDPVLEIIAKASAGDEQAFRMLVEKYQSTALLLAIRLTGNRVDAEDIVQEVFIRIWKHLPRYDNTIRFTTWMYTIVTNRCLDYLRSKRYRQSRITDTWDHHSSVAASGSSFDDREFAAIVSHLAEELTPKQRAVFVLRDLHGLSVAEVREILAMTEGNIKSNLYHARIKLSEWIKKYYNEKQPRQS